MPAKHIQIAQTKGAKAGFAAYCAHVQSGQGSGLPTVKAKAERILGKNGRKSAENAFKSYCKEFGLSPNIKPEAAAKAAEIRGDSPKDIAQIVASVIAAMNGGSDENEDTSDQRESRTIPADAARNAVLWRLNVEGLLSAALDASEGDYITQDAGKTVLTAAFGPLTK